MAKKRRISAPLPHFILNPAASAGKSGKYRDHLLRSLEEHFPDGFVLDVTSRPGHATEITRQALKAGAKLVVAVGGDGTINEVVNGFFEKKRLVAPQAVLGFLCIGTAKDVARNLGLPSALEEQLRVLKDQGRRTIDLGSVTCDSGDGERLTRFFINDCQPGIAATVVKRVTPGLKRLGGFLAFGIGSTASALTYRAPMITVRVNGKVWESGRFLGVTAANGRFAGGGMDFAPASRIDDGFLDLLIIRDLPILSRLMNFPKIYSGKHVTLPWVLSKKGKRLSVAAVDRVGIEADGELVGYLPCDISVVPRALTVAAPRPGQK